MWCRLILRLFCGFALIAMAGGAAGAVPPVFVVEQQDRAVRAYCAEWRKTHNTLSADQMNKRVTLRLKERFPAVFPDCRSDGRENCVSWLSALVEGLRRYGSRSLGSVCSDFRDQVDPPFLKVFLRKREKELPNTANLAVRAGMPT